MHGNSLYLGYAAARKIHQEKALAEIDWYKDPPTYDSPKLDPYREQPRRIMPFYLEKISLHGCRFPPGAELKGANFHGSDLTGSVFQDANLRDASFDPWGGSEPRTILAGVSFLGGDLTGASFKGADMTGVHFEPATLPQASNLAEAEHLQQMTFDTDPTAMLSLRQHFRDAGFSLQDSQVNYAINHRILEQQRERCSPGRQGVTRDYSACLSYLGSRIVEATCEYGLNLWRPLKIAFLGWIVFTLIFFAFMHHSGPSGLYLAVAKGLVLDPKDIENAPQVRSIPLDHAGGQWLANELRVLRIAGFFSLINGFNLGVKDADIGRWLRLLPGREFEFRAVGWSRTFAGIQALLNLYLLTIWILCFLGHPFG